MCVCTCHIPGLYCTRDGLVRRVGGGGCRGAINIINYQGLYLCNQATGVVIEARGT